MIEQNFFQFLEQKGLEYNKNFTFENIKQAYAKLDPFKIHKPFIIHIIGTNGKGTTGRFLASFLMQHKYNVLHYSSPHISKINERFWINGEDISDQLLQKTHKNLVSILQDDIKRLSYFEYLTLIALVLGQKQDYLILEAGLGGEFDATNVVTNDISVIPSIALDHTNILGDTITKIATTKLKSVDKSYIFGKGVPKDAKDVAKTILKDKQEILLQNITPPKNNYPQFLQNNLILALNVIKYLKLDINNLTLPHIYGRMERQDNIIYDVGHNELAAKMILGELSGIKINLVYNSYKDKDYKKILQILKPIIKKVYIVPIQDERILDIDTLKDVLNQLDISYEVFKDIKQDEQYLVFGSFKVVQKVKKLYEK